MAHFAQAEAELRLSEFTQDILVDWASKSGFEGYFLQCPCHIDCKCVPESEFPRLRLKKCAYPGELDYFAGTQPFETPFGFAVTWHCNECFRELACGTPWLTA